MTATLPSHVVDTAVYYVVKRQRQGRPTTMRQVAKRTGVGATLLKAEFEKNFVQYILLPYNNGGRRGVVSNMELAIRTIPERLAARIGITVQDVEDSFAKIFGEVELEKPEAELPVDIDPVTNADPYAPYRINREQFETLRPELIYWRELISEARRRGYPGRAVERATGGDRMRYKLPGPLWRPYVYRNKRYFLKETLNHLTEVYRTYKRSDTAFLKRSRINQAQGLPPPVKRFTKEQMLGR